MRETSGDVLVEGRGGSGLRFELHRAPVHAAVVIERLDTGSWGLSIAVTVVPM